MTQNANKIKMGTTTTTTTTTTRSSNNNTPSSYANGHTNGTEEETQFITYVRRAKHAGSWYSSSSKALEKELSNYLSIAALDKVII